jgi:nucleoporin GLE1
VYEQIAERNRLEEQTRREQERIKVEQDRIRAAQEKIKAEEERLRAEQAAKDEQKRLRDIATKKVAPLTPLEARPPQQQPSQAPAPAPTPFSAPTPQAKSTITAQPPQQPTPQAKPVAPIAAPIANGNTNSGPATSNPFGTPTTAVKPTPAPPTPAPASGSTDPKRLRALEIHKNLKQLRAAIASQGNQNKALKTKAGDLRRELRKSVGQLSMDKKGNQVVVCIDRNISDVAGANTRTGAKDRQGVERGLG